MKILSTTQIREADNYTIKYEPIKSIDLMERASQCCVDWIKNQFGNEIFFYVFAGPGNNGGDGLAIARLLYKANYPVKVFIPSISKNTSGDFNTNFNRLKKIKGLHIESITSVTDFPEVTSSDIIIDALFGSGLSRPVDGISEAVIKKINEQNCLKISIDIPSGLFGDNNETNNPKKIVKADYTLTFQQPKLSFLFAENAIFTGNFIVLDIGLSKEFISGAKSSNSFTEESFVNEFFPKKREKFAHKGNFGHALLIAGSYGKAGASVLASKSCLKTGAGLLTTHVPEKCISVLQSGIPEAMASVDKNELYFTEIPDISQYNAIGIGPGLGTSEKTQAAFYRLLKKAGQPLVIDADALNILSLNKKKLYLLPENTILTPHPKEFDRLTKKHITGFSRFQTQIEFSKKYKSIVVLKGAFTSITDITGNCYFNSTGNPGMATAGSGDVLTGMILGLLSQGYSPLHAAIAGVYIHGLAGDIASEKESEEALISSDIINAIGFAIKKIKKN